MKYRFPNALQKYTLKYILFVIIFYLVIIRSSNLMKLTGNNHYYRNAAFSLTMGRIEPSLILLASKSLVEEKQNMLAWNTGMVLSSNYQSDKAGEVWQYLDGQTSFKIDAMLRNLAKSREGSNEIAEAGKLLNSWVAHELSDWKRHNYLGDFYLRYGQNENAVLAFEKGAIATIGTASAYLNGRAAEVIEDWQAARGHYEIASGFDDAESIVFFRQSQLLSRHFNELPTAIKVCEEAVHREPDQYACYEQLGLLYEELGDLENAKKWYHAGLRSINTSSYQALFNRRLGDVLQREGVLDDAEMYYKNAINLKLSDAKAFIGLGRVYVAQNKFELAYSNYLAAIDWGIKTKSISVGWYLELAELYLMNGDLKNAQTTYEEILEQYPDNTVAIESLQQLLGDN